MKNITFIILKDAWHGDAQDGAPLRYGLSGFLFFEGGMDMRVERSEVLCVEVGEEHYHLDCVPAGTDYTDKDLIMRGEDDDMFFCDGCEKAIS